MSSQTFFKNKKVINFYHYIHFVFINVWLIEPFRNKQYGSQGKNGIFSDYKNRTYCEIYSSRVWIFTNEKCTGTTIQICKICSTETFLYLQMMIQTLHATSIRSPFYIHKQGPDFLNRGSQKVITT